MESQEKQQEIIMKLSMFEQQTNQIREQLQAVEQGIIELTSLNNDLDELKGKEGEEIRAMIGRGIFVKAKLISEDLLVDIGEKTLVKKDIAGTKSLVQEQISKLQDMAGKMNSSLEKMNEEITKVIEQAQSMEKGNHVHDENCRHD